MLNNYIANKKITPKFIEFAKNNNLSFDNVNGVIFGTYKGYEVAIQRVTNKSNFIVNTCVQNVTSNLSDNLFQNCKKQLKKVEDIKISKKGTGNVIFTTKTALMTEKANFENLQTALDSVIDFFRINNLKSVCMNCKGFVETSTYIYKDAAIHLCPNCSAILSREIEKVVAEHNEKTENVFLGTMGALIGGFIGIVVIVLLSQLGYVAAISGVVLAFATFKGYDKLAGKTGKLGIAICIAIMIVSVFLGNHIDWVIFIYNELIITPADAFIYCLEIVDIGYYAQSLIMIFLFALLGSFGTVKELISRHNAPIVSLVKVEEN